MSTEIDPGAVANRLRQEFDLLGTAPGLVTEEVVAAGRRRRRNRLLTAGVASVAVLTAAVVTVPVVLSGDREPTVATDVKKPLTWTTCTNREAPPPPDRRLWLGSITDARLKTVVDAALEKVSPGAKYSRFEVGRSCPFLEQHANVILNITRADGGQGSIEIDLRGELGAPASRADALARSRKRPIAPLEVPADKPVERRSLGGGVEAVVYPEGVHFRTLPVDVFAGNMNITIDASAWRTPTGDKVQPEVFLEPKDSPFSIDQLLTISKALAGLAPKSVPTGPVKISADCETTPPAGHEDLTRSKVQDALHAEVLKIAPKAKFQRRTFSGVCWPSASRVALTGEDPLGGFLNDTNVYSLGSSTMVVAVELTLRAGSAVERANTVARTGEREAAGFQAPLSIDAAHRGEVRDLGGGDHAVVYPRGPGFWRMPVDLFADRQLNVAVHASGNYVSDATPENSPLTIDQLLQIAKAVAALDR